MNIPEMISRLTQETEKIIVGKHDRIELMLMALLADGHVLLDDLPGVGKTTLVKTLAIASGCESKRVQFVPDLLPSDITGMRIYDQRNGNFCLLKGPVFTNILLADEINRAVPRTQSALLAPMEEKNVTIDGETMPLPQPFMVLATQNPVESESTFRLPAAQMDRFLIRLSMGYPAPEEEKRMLFNLGDAIPFSEVKTVTGPEEILKAREEIAQVKVSDAVADYIVALVSATRTAADVVMGASPRATRALFKAGKAWAAMQGRGFVTPDDVKYLAPYVLPHRLMLSSSARLSGVTADVVVAAALANTPVPPDSRKVFDEK